MYIVIIIIIMYIYECVGGSIVALCRWFSCMFWVGCGHIINILVVFPCLVIQERYRGLGWLFCRWDLTGSMTWKVWSWKVYYCKSFTNSLKSMLLYFTLLSYFILWVSRPMPRFCPPSLLESLMLTMSKGENFSSNLVAKCWFLSWQ